MARTRMITRTVTLTMAEIMVVNITTGDTIVDLYELSGKFDNDDDILKSAQLMTDDDIKCVWVKNKEEKEVLYGMPETDFIKLAQVLPPRTTSEN